MRPERYVQREERWPSRLLTDQRGFVPAFLIKATLWFAVIAIIGHDVGQIVWSQIQVSDAAHRSAQAAANTYDRVKVDTKAQEEAVHTAAEVGNRIELKEFQVDPDGSVWTTAAEEAATLVFGHVGFLKGFTERQATAHEQPSSL